mgnify:CR=1 FL=1
MKVLHVSSAEVYGGIETILVSLARYRALCPDLEHHFALCFEGRLSDELRALDAPLYMLGNVKLSRPLSVRRARRALCSALGRSGCDVVICHGPWSMINLAAAVRASGKPLAMWAHGIMAGRNWPRWLLGRTLPDLMICNSRYTQETLVALFPSAESTVIYAPLDMASAHNKDILRATVRKELSTSADAIVIVQAGRMVPRKGQKLLIDALSDLRANASWRCWIVGGVQSRSEKACFHELESQVQKEGLTDRILFIGQRDDVPRLMAAADIFCQPNLRAESFGVVFIEAMLAGLPVVTSALGGAIEIVDRQSGILVPANDRQAVTEALRNLLADPGLRQRLGADGPARARKLCEPAARMHELRTALEMLDLRFQLASNE